MLIRYPGFLRAMRKDWGSGQSFVGSFLAACRGMPFAPRALQTVIDFETARQWSPRTRDPGSSAVGFLQWIEKTAHSLGTTTAAIAAMSPGEQFELARKTLAVNASHLRATQPDGVALVGDVYLAVWGPSYIGSPDDRVVAEEGSETYDKNPFPHALPGIITIGDIRGAIGAYHNAGISTYGDLVVGADGRSSGTAVAGIAVAAVAVGAILLARN